MSEETPKQPAKRRSRAKSAPKPDPVETPAPEAAPAPTAAPAPAVVVAPAVVAVAPAAAPVSPVDMLLRLNEQYGTTPGALPPQPAGLGGIQETGLELAVLDNVKDAAKSIVDALTTAFSTIANRLASLANDLATLDVETFVVPDLRSLPMGEQTEDGFTKLKERGERVAWTRVMLDGDIQAAVPVNQGRLNEALWQTHKDMVTLAQANRALMIKTAVDALTGLIMPPKAG